jgi:hypothetical protein
MRGVNLQRFLEIRRPVQAFVDWPELEDVTRRYVNFVSPWLVIGDENLGESTLRAAIAAYDVAHPQGYGPAYRAFMEHIAGSAPKLASVRVSVRSDEGCWMPWTYDQPLLDFCASHKRSSIQVRTREVPVSASLVLIKLLTAVSSTRQLTLANLDLARLLKAYPS